MQDVAQHHRFHVGSADGTTLPTGARVAALTGVRTPDGTPVDVEISAGTVTAVVPAGTDTRPDGDGLRLDATGWRVLPAACEPHAHLDKTHTASRVPAGTGLDLVGAVTSWREIARDVDGPDVAARARRAVERYAVRGTTTIRTHVDAPAEGDPLRLLDPLLALRDEVAGSVALQVCLLGGSHTSDDVYLEAARRGVDVLGGCPHLSPDPAAEISRVLDLAERTGLPVDLHADEQTALPPHGQLLDVADLAQQVLARGLQQRVTASHVVRLGSLPPDRLGPVVDLLARAGLGVVTLPITNLYLQGRDSTHLVPRGLTAVRALLDAGVPVAAGADNVRDPFNPAGTCDPFETTSLLMTVAHLGADEALAAVTSGARAVLGLPAAGPVAGHRADLLLVPDVPLGDVLAGGETARVVITGGRVVADTRVTRALALTGTAPTAPAHDPWLTESVPTIHEVTP
ncbi:cytosine deaminase [Isoptericola jiangsuensis]|uniref:Cytosine deaminase n=1 Tax=Isoptericola jiangsuensis TaxID=548579 RepID=A0A2A9ES89_9MICO|nr:amidohydrolase family protein [Isoptericola jiangsuensis]PFG41874.1 cytosine deaminase [Isoptericola jiangsuensis]